MSLLLAIRLLANSDKYSFFHVKPCEIGQKPVQGLRMLNQTREPTFKVMLMFKSRSHTDLLLPFRSLQ